MKVQARYILTTLTIFIIMVMSTSYVFRQLQEQSTQSLTQALNKHHTQTFTMQLEQRGDQLLDYLSDALYDPLYRVNLEETYDTLLPIIQLREVIDVLVIDREGMIFHDGSQELESFGNPVEHSIIETVLMRQARWSREAPTGLELAKAIEIDGEVIGAIYVKMSLARIQEDIAATEQIIEDVKSKQNAQSLHILASLDFFLILIALVLSFLVSRSLVRPITKLMDYAGKVGEGDYDIDPSIRRKDEIGDLAQALRQMGLKLAARNKEITFLAYHDALTELPNRNRLMSYLDEYIATKPESPFTLLFIDLDEFKSINDNLGHEAGDQLLKVIAKRFTSVLRPNRIHIKHPERECDIVARFGGDEFLIYLGGTDKPEDIEAVAKRLLSVIRKPVVIGEEELLVGGSIGAASYPKAGKHAIELIKHADIAMYHAKAAGKNTLRIFTDSLREEVDNKVMTEKELRKAMDDLSQFELWYQPQFDISTGKLVGAEALIRWIHPEKGMISPIQFIEIAEITGLINPIGDWVIEKVCEQLAIWREALPEGFHMALNLSARQMYRANLSEQFVMHMERYGIAAEQIHAEITETMLTIDEEEAKRTLGSLKDKGIQIWLDDFGTGFSSLSHLRQYPVDGIKIDRSFIMYLEKDEHNQQIARAILAMADELDLPVVAEGIELAEHVDFLKAQACEYGQGYHYNKPLKPQAFFDEYLS